MILLFAVTAVSLTVQVPADALVEHEIDPAPADPHETTLGFAAVPFAPQLVVVLYLV